MGKGDDALRGVFEAIHWYIFPAEDREREIEWMAVSPFPPAGSIKIGTEELAYEVLRKPGKETVPAGQAVDVYRMQVKFN